MNEDRAQMVLVSLLAASEPLSPWDLQCQRAKDKDNRTSRDCFRAGVSENSITCGQGQVCRVSSLLFVGVSPAILFLKIWTNCANCRMLTAASTEPRVPALGKGTFVVPALAKPDTRLTIKQELGEVLSRTVCPKFLLLGGVKELRVKFSE